MVTDEPKDVMEAIERAKKLALALADAIARTAPVFARHRIEARRGAMEEAMLWLRALVKVD